MSYILLRKDAPKTPRVWGGGGGSEPILFKNFTLYFLTIYYFEFFIECFLYCYILSKRFKRIEIKYTK